MTQRRRLDHFLLQKAADAGAEVREGETVDARELDARIVIGADGCNGSSAKQLGLADGVVHGVALEANYPYETRYAGAMVLEIAVIRGGYGWIFPKGDHLNVGVGGNEEEASKLRAELRRMCEAYGIDPGGGHGHARLPAADAAAADAARARYARPSSATRPGSSTRSRATGCTRRSTPRSSSRTRRSTCSPGAPRTSTRTRPRSSGGSCR